MSDPGAPSRPTTGRSPSPPGPRLPRQVFHYLVIGGLTVIVDLGLLALLHESYGVPLGVATTVAFCTAVTVNFALNRAAMSSQGSWGLTQHALRYGSLVVANYVITVVVVMTAGHLGDRYLVAKASVVAVSTLWNFLLYRHWVFTPPRPTSSTRSRAPWAGGDLRPRGDRSVQPSDPVLLVPAHGDGDGASAGSGDDLASAREGPLEDSGPAGEQDPGREHRV